MMIKGKKIQTPLERRLHSKPWLIAFLCTALSPLICIIYGIRQRSWYLALVPPSLILIRFFMIPEYLMQSNNFDIYKAIIEYSIEIGGGLITYVISQEVKSQSQGENS